MAARLVTRTIGGGGWALYLALTVAYFVDGVVRRPPDFLVDWSIYLAGAQELADRTLYRHPLHSVGLPMSAFDFKLPPLAALPGVPFAWMDPVIGGALWTAVNFAAMAAAAVLLCRMLNVRPAWAFAGIALGAIALTDQFGSSVRIGNVNPLVLLGVAAFAWAHLERRETLAGVLLALVIAVKLWPLALVAVVIRDHRWRELLTVAIVLFAQAIAVLVWLGPDVVADIISTSRAALPFIDPRYVFFVSWLALNATWWPVWGAAAVAALILLIPARGRIGIGLGIIAGLALITNLWNHYQPTFLFGAALAVVPLMAYYPRNWHSRKFTLARDETAEPTLIEPPESW